VETTFECELIRRIRAGPGSESEVKGVRFLASALAPVCIIQADEYHRCLNRIVRDLELETSGWFSPFSTSSTTCKGRGNTETIA
jgi:hypothetical protein